MGWRKRYYEDGYLRRWTLGPPGASEDREAAALLQLVGQSPPIRILDVGCGHGRLCKPLADLGNTVVGLDASLALLRRAVAQSADTPSRTSWVQGDMEALPFLRCFDLILVKDAFGHVESEGDDREFLRGTLGVLEPGGHLVLKNPNANSIRGGWKDELREERDGRTVLATNQLDLSGRWLDQDLQIVESSGQHRYHRRQRLYDSTELTHLLESAGFDRVCHFADFDGAPLADLSSTHIVTVSQRTSGS